MFAPVYQLCYGESKLYFNGMMMMSAELDLYSYSILKQQSTERHVFPLGNNGSRGGGAPGARPPPKIGKNKIFWRKIVIFHTKYPKNFRACLRSAQFF
jgi:hypothetical protein